MNIKEQWYYFKYGVQNLIKWFYIIWNDRDWDNHYIYEVLKFKLIKQAKYIGNHNIHTRAKRDAEIMNLCVKLIQRCQDEYYDSEFMDYHVSEFYCEDNGSCKSRLISETFDDYFLKYPLQYKKVMNGQISMFKRPIENLSKERIAREIAYENQQRCRRLLFKLLEINIEKWWD
jgi:hypothetical protein